MDRVGERRALRVLVAGLVGGFAIGVISRSLVAVFWSVSWLPVGYVLDAVMSTNCGATGSLVTLLLLRATAGIGARHLAAILSAVVGAATGCSLWLAIEYNPGQPGWVMPANGVLSAAIYIVGFVTSVLRKTK